MRIQSAFLIPLTALLAACASPAGLQPRLHAADPALLAAPQSLAAPEAPWPATDWWAAYGDPQLDRLVDAALRDNPSLGLAQARIDKARALAGGVAAADGLQVGANIESSRQRLPREYIYPPPLAGGYASFNRAALDFSLELDLWGRNRAALDAAIGQARAAESEAAGTRLALAAAVTQSYLQFDRLVRLRDVAGATLRQRERLQELTRLRRDAGLDSRAEVQQAAGGIAAARSELQGLDTQLEAVRHQLAALIGQGPDALRDLAPPRLHAPAAGLPSQVPADLLGRRPDVVAQRWRVEATRRDSDAARAAFYPNVNLSAFVGVQAIGLSNLAEGGNRILGIGPALHLPIFDSGRLRAGLAGRQAEQDAAVADYNATLLRALQEVADALSAWRGSEAETREQQQALARYEDAWRLIEIRYEAGLAPYTAVLAAETPLLAQRRLAAELHSRRLEASAGLARALGGGALGDIPTVH